MQVDPIRPTLKAPVTKRLKLEFDELRSTPVTKRLKLEFDELLSTFAFNSNLRRFTKAITATSVHIKVSFHLDVLDVDFEISVLFIKRTGAKKWSTVLYAGMDIPKEKFRTPGDWAFVGEILNVILLVAGDPNKLGFIYTKQKMRIAVGEDIPDVLPYKAGNLRKGLNMYTESNLNESPPKVGRSRLTVS